MKTSITKNNSILRTSTQLKRFAHLTLTLLLLTCSQILVQAQTWSSTGALATARYGHTATLLKGKLLVTGGTNSGSILSSCELYNLSTGTWSSTGALKAVRSQHTATLLSNGKVLVVDGTGPFASALTSCELYDTSTGTWSSTGASIKAKYAHTATLLSNGKVLVTGGNPLGLALSSCELYDPSTGTWSSTGSLTTARYSHTATLLSSGKVLVTGGSGNRGFVSSSEIYDPSTGTWSSTGALTAARYNHTATLLSNGKVLVSGGQNNSGYLSSCELYDPSTETWSSTGAHSAVRSQHTATLLSGGKVLVSGGVESGGPLSSCELYDPSVGTWSSTGALTSARTLHTITLLSDGKVMVSGGMGVSKSTLSSCELYGTSCTVPTIPTLSTTSSSNCGTQSTTLSIASGTLNDATAWKWYSGSCGGTSAGSGTSISVSPSSTTTYYARGEGGCVTPGACANITITVSQLPTTPTLSASSTSICTGSSATLNIATGTLNSATNWYWYSESCGGTAIGTGTSVSVSPTVTTTYYARGEGACTGSCGNITITVFTDVYNGNAILQTQTQMNSFVSGGGCLYSKVDGNLVIDGSNSSDPITSLSNLSLLNEVTGNMTIRNFNKSGNPTDLKYLSQLKDAGGQLIIVSNSELQNVTLPKLAIVWNGFTIQDNNNLKVISMPKLYNVKFNLKIKNNPHTESILFSTDTSFVSSRAGLDAEISNNGGSAANPLTMEFKKISRFNNLIFDNNDNSGVSDFNNIFSGITAAKTLTVTNNGYLAACCKVASCVVSVGRTVTGNTGDCADLAAVTTACGTLHKMSPKASVTSNKETSFDVSPNPAKGQFNLQVSPSVSGIVNLTVTDLMGRMVFNQNYTVNSDTNIPLNMDFVAEGQYIVKAEMNGEQFIKRVMLVR